MDAMQFNPQRFTRQQWYIWYVQDEFGADLFEQELRDKPMPSDTVTHKFANFRLKMYTPPPK